MTCPCALCALCALQAMTWDPETPAGSVMPLQGTPPPTPPITSPRLVSRSASLAGNLSEVAALPPRQSAAQNPAPPTGAKEAGERKHAHSNPHAHSTGSIPDPSGGPKRRSGAGTTSTPSVGLPPLPPSHLPAAAPAAAGVKSPQNSVLARAPTPPPDVAADVPLGAAPHAAGTAQALAALGGEGGGALAAPDHAPGLPHHHHHHHFRHHHSVASSSQVTMDSDRFLLNMPAMHNSVGGLPPVRNMPERPLALLKRLVSALFACTLLARDGSFAFHSGVGWVWLLALDVHGGCG